MKPFAFLAIVILLSGCQRSSRDDALLAALPAEVRLPSCSTMWISDSWHRRNVSPSLPRYSDTVFISTTQACIVGWTKSLEGKDDCEFDVHGCPMYSRMDDRGAAVQEMVIVIERFGSNVVVVHWAHPKPIPGIWYGEGS